MYKRILPAFVATLAFLNSASAAKLGELERPGSNVAAGELNPYVARISRTDLYPRGIAAAYSDEVAWQLFCSFVYEELNAPRVTTQLREAAYANCLDMASSAAQTKESWVALLSSIAAVGSREPQPSESELALLADGEFAPYLTPAVLNVVKTIGNTAARGDNLTWQAYCSFMYGQVQGAVPNNALGAAYVSCKDIASSDEQTKLNWIHNYFGT